MNEVDIVPSDDIWSLCERLRVEKLLISSEVSCLQQLHDEIYRKFLQLGLQSWNSKQHQLLLQRLVSSHNCVSQDNCCALSAQLNSAEVEEAYRRLGHHHSLFAKCLSLLFSSPLCTAELLHAVGPNQEISSDESIHAVFGLLYGNCVFPTDEKAVLETLSCLIRVQLLSHSNPRLIIRKGTAAFPRLYKLYSESLYAVKIFLTAALHDSVMLVLCQDEVFLDIDPNKSPLRFPSADRVRRFGDDPTSAQYHKKMAVHRKLIVERLVVLTHSFIKGICDAISCFPLGLIWLVQQLNSALTDIKRLSANEAALICTDLIVTNLLCPAIINPETIGIISDTPISHIARFNLMQIGQIIQTLALSRHETPQPHFQVFISHFKDSPICGLVGSLLSRPLPSFNSIFTSILSESHRTRELFRRTYFMGSLAEVNTLVSILHSSAVSKVSSDGIRAELNELRSRLPRSFSTNVSILDLAEAPVVLTSNSHVHQSTIRVSADKAHGSMLNSLPHISNRSHYPSTLLPRECFDVIVFHIDTQSDPIGLMSEDKYMESVVVEVAPKKRIGSGTLKRTCVVDTGSTVGSAVSEHTPDNASDLEEEAEDQHEVGSIPSSLEAPQEHSGSPSLDGRESPLSQAPGRGLQDNHEIETSDLFAASTAAGSEVDPSQRVLPTGVPVAVRKQNAEGLEEKFGKFTVPISQQSRLFD
ncbi:hypothetical protein RB195_023351 [Necator americanus]|uniref:Ras-GAP domain-containing protein n=1 Tax=Necator americanus TaxID=51031 RepID=A0ABR1EIT3_NECAM